MPVPAINKDLGPSLCSFKKITTKVSKVYTTFVAFVVKKIEITFYSFVRAIIRSMISGF